MRSFLRTSIFEIVLDLMNALRLDDPRRKQLPDLAKETIDNKRSYSCTGGDVVIRRTIAHPSRQRLPLPQLGLEDMRGPGQTLNFQLEQEKKSQAYLASTAERPPSRIPVRGRTQGLGSLKMSWGEVVRLAKQGFGRMWTSAGSALNEAGKSFGAGGARNGPMPNRPMKPI
ncbi:MAG: hypothetical protein M1815_001796 [Lichina confinis]|nr:MAG: hypothetical protein M1815_001796 [Lichina confinis]